MAEFVFKKGTELITFTKWEDVPNDLDFDHVIKFIPDVPPEPAALVIPEQCATSASPILVTAGICSLSSH